MPTRLRFTVDEENRSSHHRESAQDSSHDLRTLKDQCAYRHRFETLQHASRVIGDWVSFYNHPPPHQALAMKNAHYGFRVSGMS